MLWVVGLTIGRPYTRDYGDRNGLGVSWIDFWHHFQQNENAVVGSYCQGPVQVMAPMTMRTRTVRFSGGNHRPVRYTV